MMARPLYGLACHHHTDPCVEKALKGAEIPTMGMMYYNVPDMRIVPPLQDGDNGDYLKRLEKAMDEHGIELQRYQRLSEVVYCL